MENENITISPQTFTSKGNLFTLNASACTFNVKINGKDVSDYLKAGTSVGWYDVSKNSGRDTTNANGTMVLNVIDTKYRLDLVCRHLTNDEMVDFYSEIIKQPTMEVEFYNLLQGKIKQQLFIEEIEVQGHICLMVLVSFLKDQPKH